MGEENEQVLSREEYIALARQSCIQSLNEKSTVSKTKHKDRLVKRPYADEFEDNYAGLYHSDSVITKQNATDSTVKMRGTLIRIIFTMIFFLSIFVIDKFKLSYHKINSSMIENAITNNDFIEKAESFVATILRGDKTVKVESDTTEEPVTETSGDKLNEK